MKKAIILLVAVFATAVYAQEYDNSVPLIGNTSMENRVPDFPKLKVTASVAGIGEIHEACGMTKWLWVVGAWMQGCTSFDNDLQWAHIRMSRYSSLRDLRHEVKHTCGEYHGDKLPKYVAAWRERTGWKPSPDNVCTSQYEQQTFENAEKSLREQGWSPSEDHTRNRVKENN